MSSKLTVSKPNAILISIFDILSPFKLHLQNLEKFFEENLEGYIKSNRQEKRIARIVRRIKKEEPIEACQMNKQSIFKQTDTEDEVLDKVIKQLLDKSKQSSRAFTPVALVKDWLWSDSLTSGDLKSIVYDFVPELLDKWRMKMFIKLFSIDEADSSAQKLFFQSTQFGDLTKFFNNYIHFFKEGKSNKEFYKNIANLLRDSPDSLLFITTEFDDALAAHHAGFNCIVIKDQIKNDDELAILNRQHGQIKFTKTIQNIEFINDPSKMVDCC